MLKYIIALIAVVILFFFTCFLVSFITYVREEVNHSIKNMKRSVKEFMWGVEWRWNHR